MKKILFLLFISILLVSTVSSWMPLTHYTDLQKSLDKASGSSLDLYKVAIKYPDLVYAGDTLTDFGIFYYYSYFKRYSIPHSPVFCRALLDQARGDEETACAVGCLEHQAADLASHTQMVPYCIEHTFLPNEIIHPFCEQHADNIVNSQNPGANKIAMGKLDSYKTCADLYKRVLLGESEYTGVDLDALFEAFIAQVQTSGYKGISFGRLMTIPFIILAAYFSFLALVLTLFILIIFKKVRYKDRRRWYHWITLFGILAIILLMGGVAFAYTAGAGMTTFQWLIAPISNLVPIGDLARVQQAAIDNGASVLIYGEAFLEGTDASGIKVLTAANAKVLIPFIIMVIFLIIITVFLIWVNLRTPKGSRAKLGDISF